MWTGGFVCPQINSRFRFRLFASTTLNHELKTVFPSTGSTNPFATNDVLWSGIFRVSEPKTDFFWPGIFRVVNKTGRLVARNFPANSNLKSIAITVYICCSRPSKLISHATLCLLSSSPYFGVCGPEVLLPFRLPEVYFGPLRSLVLDSAPPRQCP